MLVRFVPNIKSDSHNTAIRTGKGGSREPPPVGDIGGKGYLLAVVAGATGATGA